MRNGGIAQAKGKSQLLKAGGSTDDIVEAVLDTVPEVRSQTRDFARQFSPDTSGLRDLWYWVKTNIQYREDPLGVQWIREPARLWHDRVGDCKSFTVFIVSVMENMGLKYFIRFANTESAHSRRVNHVYPVALLPGGRQIIMDAVYTAFNSEHSFYNAVDYTMTEIYRLSGIGDAPQAAVVIDQLDAYAADLKQVLANIPDHVTDTDDITQMTDGEFARFQSAQLLEAQAATTSGNQAVRLQAAAQALKQGSIAGIGALASGDREKITTYLAQTAQLQERAFKAPVLEIPDAVSGHPRIGGLLNDIKQGWQKLMNWLFKTGFAGAAPMMLYKFLKKKNIGPKTNKKLAKADEVMQYNMETGQFKDEYTVMQAYRIGIIKNMGAQPEEVLNGAVTGKEAIAGGWVDIVMKAVSFVLDIIGKIAGLFKKKKKPAVTEADAPNEAELKAEVAAITTSKGTNDGDSTQTPNAPPGPGSQVNTALMIGGVALVAWWLTNN